jgi:hypothetical protein
MTTSSPAPGWYPDPSGQGQRYFDGRAWAQHHASAQQLQPQNHVFDVAAVRGLGVGVAVHRHEQQEACDEVLMYRKSEPGVKILWPRMAAA